VNQEDYRQLISGFPFKIQMLARNNAAVDKCLKMYATGQIITREEALCQMIVMLADDWDVRTKELFKMNQMMTSLNTVTLSNQ
jgi:hypothetical protein